MITSIEYIGWMALIVFILFIIACILVWWPHRHKPILQAMQDLRQKKEEIKK